MARMKKPPEVGRILIPLSEPKAILLDVADCTRVLYGSKQLLVEEEILAILRASNFIYPFKEVGHALITTITPEGKTVATKMREEQQKNRGKRYIQLYFDDELQEQGTGDAISSFLG